jgi:hypothetical protein
MNLPLPEATCRHAGTSQDGGRDSWHCAAGLGQGVQETVAPWETKKGVVTHVDPRIRCKHPIIYPLVNVYIAMDNHHAINGKIHELNGHFQ